MTPLTSYGRGRCSTPAGPATSRSVASPRKRPCSTIPGASVEQRREPGRVGDRAEGAVEDPVPLVGHELGAVGSAAHGHRRAHVVEVLGLRPPPELRDLHRQHAPRPELRRGLAVVDDDHLAHARLRDHLLPPQRASRALDEVERGIDVVGAVDREIDHRVLGQRGERDARRDRLGLARERRRDPDDLPQLTARDAGADGRMACTAVLPVPSPTTMPGSTHDPASSPAACFCSSTLTCSRSDRSPVTRLHDRDRASRRHR